MGEKTILVCDTCGKPAAETVTIKVARGNYVKDLCSAHVSELIAGARKPRRGRPKAVVAGSAPRPAPRKTAARTTKAAPKRRGRPRKRSA